MNSNDEDSNDDAVDSKEDTERGYDLFPLLADESFFVYELKTVVKNVLQRMPLSGREVREVGAVLFALERLPRSTPGIAVGLTLAYRANNESTFCELFVSENELRLSKGGNTYDPAVGSDSYGITCLEMETSGYRDGASDSGEVISWFDSINELLSIGNVVDLEYLGDDRTVDWFDEGCEDFWADVNEE